MPVGDIAVGAVLTPFGHPAFQFDQHVDVAVSDLFGVDDEKSSIEKVFSFFSRQTAASVNRKVFANRKIMIRSWLLNIGFG